MSDVERHVEGIIQARPTGVRHAVLALLALAAASAYLTRHCLAVANTTIQEELGFDNQDFGYLYSAFSLGYLICQVPGGWLGQRLGTRWTMPLLSTAWSAFTLVTAAVTSLGAMAASRFGFGLAQAGLIPNQAKVVRDWFPPSTRGTVSAVIAMSMSVGGVATMWLTARLLKWYHWRDIFRAYSLVGIAWAVVFFLVFRTRPEEHPGVNESERRLIRGRVQGVGEEGRGPALSWVAVLGSMSMWALCGQMIFRAAGYNFFVTFFPAFLEFAYGIPKEDAGILTTWPLLGVVAGSLLGGTLVDRLYRWTGSKRASRCGVAVGTLLVTAALTWASAYTDSAEGLAAVIAAGALASGMSMACPWAAVIDLGGRNAAVAMGVMNSAGCLAGILISPEVGRLMDTVKASGGDWNLVIYLHAAFYLASALFWVAVNPDRPIGHKGAGE